MIVYCLKLKKNTDQNEEATQNNNEHNPLFKKKSALLSKKIMNIKKYHYVKQLLTRNDKIFRKFMLCTQCRYRVKFCNHRDIINANRKIPKICIKYSNVTINYLKPCQTM